MIFSLILCATAAVAIPAGGDSPAAQIVVDSTAPNHAGEPVLHPFVSFSIEFAWFPAFAGL